MSRATDQSQRLSDTALTVDMHTHGLSIMPRWLRAVGGKTIDMPAAPLSKLSEGKVNLAIVTVVGDAALGTAWRLRSPWHGVRAQLTWRVRRLRQQVSRWWIPSNRSRTAAPRR